MVALSVKHCILDFTFRRSRHLEKIHGADVLLVLISRTAWTKHERKIPDNRYSVRSNRVRAGSIVLHLQIT